MWLKLFVATECSGPRQVVHSLGVQEPVVLSFPVTLRPHLLGPQDLLHTMRLCQGLASEAQFTLRQRL